MCIDKHTCAHNPFKPPRQTIKSKVKMWMSIDLDRVLRTLGISILAIVILSIAGGLAPLTQTIYKAQAQGSITTSSPNLHPAKVIKIEVTGTGDLGPLITLQVKRADTGEVINVKWKNGTVANNFTATRIAGRYVAYLGGNATNLDENPKFPLPVDISSIANIGDTDLPRSTILRIEVPILGIFTTVRFDTVASTATIPKDSFPYRRNALIPITFTDHDLNKDPTSLDNIPIEIPNWLNVTITLVRSPAAGGGQIGPFTVNVTNITSITGIVRFNETAIDSGTYIITTSIVDLSSIITNRSGTNVTIGANDTVILVFRTTEVLQGGPGWADRATEVSQVVFKAVYTPPTISVSADSKKVVIEIISPDDNVNPGVKDTLDTGGPILVNLTDYTPIIDLPEANLTIAGVTVKVGELGAIETGPNTGVFRLELSLGWNTTPSIDITKEEIILPVGVDGPFVISARYFAMRPPGYGIDASGLGVYSPEKASLTVVKSSLKSWVINVSDADLNNLATVAETLRPFYATPGNADFFLNKTVAVENATVARLTIVDELGNFVSVKGTPLATEVITFVETDFDSGKFEVIINASLLNIVSGEMYFIRYLDLTGFSEATGRVETNLTVVPVRIILDRTVYPVNRDLGVAVYIRYDNDFYDKNPTERETAFVNISIVAVDNTVISRLTNVFLNETGINTGIFTRRIVIPAANFTSPKIIDARLTVEDTTVEGVPRATAVFRPNPASISVNATAIRFGDTIEVRVTDPDGNRDSRASDEISVRVSTPRTAFNITLSETGVNTGEFVATLTVSWDDPSFEDKLFPGDTITFTFTDNTPVMAPTAPSWTTVPYVATVKMRTFTGDLRVKTVVDGFVGPFEIFDVEVGDPDLNRYMQKADTPGTDQGHVVLAVEGVPQTIMFALNETGANTGTFEITGLSIVDVLKAAGIITGGEDPRTLASILAGFIGKTVIVSYVDMQDATGSRNVINKILRIRAFDASIITSPADFVNVGETLTITVNNTDIAGTPILQYKLVTVKSTSYPAGLQFSLTEVRPGVFQINLTVVDPAVWTVGAPQIPAKFGDTITIEYVDPITADGRANVAFTKQLIVGRFLERPANATSVDLLDPVNGTPITPRVNVPVLITANISNMDVIDRSMTVFIIVRDDRNVTVGLFVGTITVRAGGWAIFGAQWIPFAAGNYTIEIIVVKTLTDRTPLADVFTRRITVSS